MMERKAKVFLWMLVLCFTLAPVGNSQEKWNIQWTDYSKNPIDLQGAGERWYMPYALYNETWTTESRYRIWFDYASISGIGYATSSDGITWTTSVAVSGINTEGSSPAGRPVLLYNTAWAKPFRLYYYGNPGDIWQVRVAESTDGIKFENDKLALSADTSELGTFPDGHAVLYQPGRTNPFLMYYLSKNGYIMVALSKDGYEFTDFNQVPESQALQPTCVISLGQNDYRMWAFRDNTANQYLVSPDGFDWTLQEDPVKGVGAKGETGAWNDQRNYYASVVYLGEGKFKMFRSGRDDASGLYRIGLADGFDAQLAKIHVGKWEQFSPLDNYQSEGWTSYTSNDNQNGSLKQNADGTVLISDDNESGNYYLVHDVAWLVPFTVEARLRVDEAGGNDANGPHCTISLFINDPVNPGGESWQPSFGLDKFGGWNLSADPTADADLMQFHTFTVVCRFNEEARERLIEGDTNANAEMGAYDVYIDRDYSKPVTFHGTGFAGWPEVDIDGRLDIGWPNPSTGKMTVDWVRWGSGIILDPKEPGTDVPHWDLY